MKAYNIKIKIALFLLLGVVLWLSPFQVWADATNPSIAITNPPTGDISAIQSICSDVNNNIHEEGIWNDNSTIANATGVSSGTNFLECTTSSDIITITVNMVDYKKLDTSSQQTVMEVALNTIYDNNNLSRTNRNKLYNELCALDDTTAALVRQLGSDTSGDFVTAYNWFKTPAKIVSTVLGIIALVLFGLFGITMVLDIAYITLPLYQSFITNLNKEPGSHKFVSYEALEAIKESESKSGTDDYVNPLSIYFAHKTKQYIAMAICLLYLVSGQIYNVLSIIIDYFSGLIN